ncbi:MAG: primosomal protein N', partial [Lachnospiraceae bacterium]|nr:primosomal protein N' [Lachnospiraceae bacterium]
MGDFCFAKVIINISHESVDRPFTYIIPNNLKGHVEAGTKVVVPFGKGNSLKEGIVLEVTDKADLALDKLKEIDSVSPKAVELSDQRIALASWIKRNYGSTMIAALKTVLPVQSKVKENVKKTVVRKVSLGELDAFIETATKKNNVAQLRLALALKDE